MTRAPGRNEPCHCGSGLKYKKCCWAQDQKRLADAIPKPAQAPALDPSQPPPKLDPLPEDDLGADGAISPNRVPEGGGTLNTLMLIAAVLAVIGAVVAVFSNVSNGLLVFGVGLLIAILWTARRPPPPRVDPPRR